MGSVRVVVVIAALASACASKPTLTLDFSGIDPAVQTIDVLLHSPERAFTGQPSNNGNGINMKYLADGDIELYFMPAHVPDDTLVVGVATDTALDLDATAIVQAPSNAFLQQATASTRVAPAASARLAFDFGPPGSDMAAPPGSDLAAPPGSDLAGGGTGASDMTTATSNDFGAGGPSHCPGSPPFAVCDGFESGTINSSLWTTNTDPGVTVTVDNTMGYRGTHSVHIHLPATNASATESSGSLLETYSFVPNIMPTIHMRGFFYAPATLAHNGELMSILQNSSPYNGIAAEERSGTLGTENGIPSAVQIYTSTTMMPVGRWFCLEWSVGVSNNATVQVWLDDVMIQSNTGENTNAQNPPLGATQFGLGFFKQSSLPAMDLWMDELVVDGNHIGCAN